MPLLGTSTQGGVRFRAAAAMRQSQRCHRFTSSLHQFHPFVPGGHLTTTTSSGRQQNTHLRELFIVALLDVAPERRTHSAGESSPAHCCPVSS